MGRLGHVFKQGALRTATALILLSSFTAGNASAFSLFGDGKTKHDVQPLAVAEQPAKTMPVSVGNDDNNPDLRPGSTTQKVPERKPLRELPSEFTPTKKVTLNTDGSRSVDSSITPQRYKQSDGSWQEIDSTLKQVSTFPVAYENTVNEWKVRFESMGLMGRGVVVSDGATEVNFNPVGGGMAEPGLGGTAPFQTITYKNVWPGVSLQYMVSNTSVKENIIVDKNAKLTEFNFDLAGGGTLEPSSAIPNAYFVRGSLLDGFTVTQLTVATQTAGVIGDKPYVDQSISKDGKRLTIKLDADWLKSLSPKDFPVVIDPSVTSDTPTSNTGYTNYKSDGYVCPYGGGCGNSVGTSSDQLKKWRFVTNIPSSQIDGKYLINASMWLQMPSCGNQYGICDNTATYVSRATCWGYDCIDTVHGQGQSWWGTSGWVDVTGLYRNLQSAGLLNAALEVQGMEVGWNTYKMFGWDATFVRFTYDSRPPAPTYSGDSIADGGTVTTSQPTLTANPSADSDGDKVYYYYSVGTAAGGNNQVVGSGWTPFTSWTIPDNTLEDGKTYYWKVFAWDKNGYVPAWDNSSPARSFKYDSRLGKGSTQAFDTVGGMSVNLATGNLVTGNASHSSSALGGSLGVALNYNSPVASQPGLTAQFWNGSISGDPVVTRTDPNINFNWGYDSPSTSINADQFSSRWSGYFIAPVAGTYYFGGTYDDNFTVYINDQSVFSTGCCSSTPNYGSAVTLSAGQVAKIQVDHYDGGGPGYATLYVKGAVSEQIVPNAWLRTAPKPISASQGLIGRYYWDNGSHNINPADGTLMVRRDSQVNFNWGTGGPMPGEITDGFMIRWSGYVTVPATGAYYFGTNSDDGSSIYINGTQVVNHWVNGGASLIYGNSINLSAGQTVPIQMDYYEVSGPAQAQLYVKGPSTSPVVPEQIVPAAWLSNKVQALPDGWTLGLDASGGLSYNRAKITQDSVVLVGSAGDTHEYKPTSGNLFAPPAGEAGQLVKNNDSTYTLTDANGIVYVFDSGGNITSATTPLDDRQPASLQYTYASPMGAPSRLTQITDRVDTSRWAKLYYSGDSACASAPSGFDGSAPANMLCQVATNDGRVTNFYYKSGLLGRIEKPGGELTDYGYNSTDCSGCITQVRDSLAADAVAAGQRTDDANITTQVAYNKIGRVTSITLPAATTGATRMSNSYSYYVANNGDSAYSIARQDGTPTGGRKVTYDNTLRTLTDTQETGFSWNDTTPLIGDFNGDGKKDMAYVNNSANGASGVEVMVALSTGSSYQTPVRWLNLPNWSYSGIKPVTGDFSGDGKTDIGFLFDINGTSASIQIATSTGSAFNSPSAWYTMTGWTLSTMKPIAGDFNGDGKTDFAELGKQTDGHADLQVFISTGTAFYSPAQWLNLTGWGWDGMKIFTGDFNGDGKADFASLNGASNGSEFRVALSTGSSFPYPSQWAFLTGWLWDGMKPFAADFTGDGKADIAELGQPALTDSDFMMFASTGSGLQSPSQWWHGGNGWSWSSLTPVAADSSGDGKADLTFFSNGTGKAGGDQTLTATSTGSGLNTLTNWLSGQTTTTEWDSVKDLVKSTTGPTSLKSTTIYDQSDRPTDAYGPAPTAWFNSDGTPNSTHTNQIPHSQTGYDQNINGLAVAYYLFDQPSKTLTGAPQAHSTNLVGAASTDMSHDYTSAGAIPGVLNNWGFSATGKLVLPNTGNYTFRIAADNGVRMYIDDQVVIDDWNEGTRTNHPTYVFNNTSANTPHRVRIDWFHETSSSAFTLYITPPGQGETTQVTQFLKPDYGLATTNKVFDSVLGDTTTTTNFGSNPELGLAQSQTVDPAGLNYSSSQTYETPGAGSYLRQTSKTLPGGNTYSYTYYGATETRVNPCNSGQTFKQAGMGKTRTAPSPGSPQVGQTTETVYDDAGRPVASRNNSDSWTCKTYDSRGRVASVTQPDISGRPGRTLTYNYAVSGNPFNGSVTDSVTGTSSVTIDLLGRTVVATDTFGYTTTPTYDTLGRTTQVVSLKGTETLTYDNLSRVTGYALDGTTYATVAYDSYGRLQSVNYPNATNGTGTLQLSSIARDSLQRTTGSTFTLANNATVQETVSLSPQKGTVTADSITYNGTTAGSTYLYDALGRLTSATVDNMSYTYAFGSQNATCATVPGYNANANRNGNRSNYTITDSYNSANNSNNYYCYNSADQLATTSDVQIGTPTYDDHGNITQLAGNGTPITFTYNASDQNITVTQGAGSSQNKVEYVKSAGGSVLIKREYRNNVLDKVYRNASGVMLTCSTSNQNSCTAQDRYVSLPGGVSLTLTGSIKTYSLTNFHGDTMMTVGSNGLPTSSVFLYDPFGQVISSHTFNTNLAGMGNATDNPMAWANNPTRKAESLFSIPIIQMGARVYLPTLGRFLQVDPVEGGTDNAYSYVNDPVNFSDYNGQGWLGDLIKSAIKMVVNQILQSVKNIPMVGPKIYSVATTAVAVISKAVSYMSTPSGNNNKVVSGGNSSKASPGSSVSSSGTTQVYRPTPQPTPIPIATVDQNSLIPSVKYFNLSGQAGDIVGANTGLIMTTNHSATPGRVIWYLQGGLAEGFGGSITASSSEPSTGFGCSIAGAVSGIAGSMDPFSGNVELGFGGPAGVSATCGWAWVVSP